MGQKFAAHDAQGKITAFYDSIDSPPPAEVVTVKITDAQWQAAISTPGYTVVAGELTPPPAPTAAQLLAQAQAAAWDAIKAERDRRTLQGGYQVGNYWFHSDTFSRTQQLGLVMLGASMPANVQWKTMTGEFVAMTPALAQQIFSAAAASDIAIFGAAEQHRAQMEACADPVAYDFTSGWPPVFEG